MLAYFGINRLTSVTTLRNEKQKIAGMVDKFDRRVQEAKDARTAAIAELGAELNELNNLVG